MSAIKRVAVAGATGYVGYPIVNALLDSGAFEVLALVRDNSTGIPHLHELEPRRLQIHKVSYEDEGQLASILRGVDVMISTVAYSSVESQVPLMKACVTSGVKLFFPSEFALELASDTSSNASKTKKAVAAVAQGLGLPIVRVFNGLFPHWYITNTFFQFCPNEKRILIYGSGNEKNSWTRVEDVARFVAYILHKVPISQLENQKLRIEADRKSFNEFVEIWEKKHKVKLDVTYKPIEELDARIANDPNDHEAAIGREMFSGRASEGPLANSLYPNWNPTPLEDAI